MRHIVHKYKISMYKTTVYRSQSNGSIERSHRVLMESLKQWSRKHDWDKYVTGGMKAYNTSVHECTEFTPHELLFGKAARVLTSSILPNDNDNESYPEYTTALFKRIFDAQATAREILKRAKIRSMRYYDRKTNPQTFKEDHYVYLLKEPSKSKFDKQYTGPYKILEILENNVKLAISDKRIKIVHSDKLRISKTQSTESS